RPLSAAQNPGTVPQPANFVPGLKRELRPRERSLDYLQGSLGEPKGSPGGRDSRVLAATLTPRRSDIRGNPPRNPTNLSRGSPEPFGRLPQVVHPIALRRYSQHDRP